MESKKDIRKRILSARKQMSEGEWKAKSNCIMQKVISHPFFLNMDKIYCYLDYQFEAETRGMIKTAWELGKQVAVPRIEGDEMKFYYIQNFSEVEPGYRGIEEPISERIADGQDGLMIMPGVAFDRNRNRIGYGKGFYDRYLAQHQSLQTMAIGFELQITDQIPAEETDYRPSILITEESVYV